MSHPYPIAQSTAVAGLSVANACYVCSTAMVGVSLLITSLPQIIACGVLATLVDLDVNRITLRNGIKKMVEPDYLLLRLTRQYLLNLSEIDTPADTIDCSDDGLPSIFVTLPDFLAHYRNVYDHYQRLKGAPLRHAHPLYAARRELQALERHAAQCLLDPNRAQSDTLTAALFTPTACATFSARFYRLQRLVRSTWLINLVAGCGTALITAYTAHAALLDIALLLTGTTLTIGPAVVIPIAVAAGAWYAITTFNNLHDILVNETIRHKWQQIQAYLASQDAAHPWRLRAKKLGLLLGVAVILTLGVFMTIATAGTWWYGIKQGAHLLPLLSKWASHLVALVVPCVALAAFLFNFNNFLESAWKAQKLLVSSSVCQLLDGWLNQWQHESWLERLNLFRVAKTLLESPIKVFIFIGHVLSVGAITDRVPHVPPVIPMLVGAACESGEDFHFVMSKDPGIITYLVAIILLPLTTLDALWRFAFQDHRNLSAKSFSTHFTECLGIEAPTAADTTPTPAIQPVSDNFKNEWHAHQLQEGLKELRGRYTYSLSQKAERKREAIDAFLKGKNLHDDDAWHALESALKEKRYGLFATRGKTFGETRLAELRACTA